MDPLNEALKDAVLASLLGTVSAPLTVVDNNGSTGVGTVTIPSAFSGRIQQMAYQGAFDTIILEAVAKVETAAIARAFEGLIANQIMQGLEKNRYGPDGWLSQQAKNIAVEAVKQALSEDENLKDTLRAKIGYQVDSNRVGITVSLSDPEAT